VAELDGLVRARALVCLGVVALGATSCSERAGASDAGVPLHPIDAVYERYKEDRSWVDPSEPSRPLTVEVSNEGSFATCARCDYEICYEPLPITQKLRIGSDADLVRMVRWLRDTDPCVRRVAEEVVGRHLGLVRGSGMSVAVQDTRGFEYHEIVCSLKARLDASGTAYDPKTFDGVVMSLPEKEISTFLAGRWEESVKPTAAWKLVAEISGDTIRVKMKATVPEPNAVDPVWSNRLEDPHVNAMSQLEVDGRSSDLARRRFLFWPIDQDQMWMAYSGQGAELGDPNWKKMRRSR
jgi:hypothetical protein